MASTRTVAETAHAVFRTQLQALGINLPGSLTGVDPISLHDFRVANRRTRSGLSEFKNLFRPEELDYFQGEFRWVQQVTNSTRDLDVFLSQFPTVIEKIPEEDQPLLSPVEEMLAGWQGQAREQMAADLKSERFQQLIARWDEVLDVEQFQGTELGQETAREYGSRRIIKRYRQVLKRGEDLSMESPQAQFHKFRIRVKKLRYAVEFFRPDLDREEIYQLARSLSAAQDAFGVLQDAAIQLDLLQRCGTRLDEQDVEVEKILVLGQLIGRLKKISRKRKKAALRQAGWLTSPATARTFQQVFQYPVNQ